jgi:hypothetical protein
MRLEDGRYVSTSLGSSGLVLKDSTLYGKIVLKRSVVFQQFCTPKASHDK